MSGNCTQITLKGHRCKNKAKHKGLCGTHSKRVYRRVTRVSKRVSKRVSNRVSKRVSNRVSKRVPTGSIKRFITAQASTYAQAKAELSNGSKQGHWIWFIFPQLPRHGTSAMSAKYAIKSRNEAEEYMATPILQKRYLELVDITYRWLVVNKLDPHTYIGADVVKLRSSLQLFNPILKSKKIDAILNII